LGSHPGGVIEMKTGWASRDAPRRAELTAALAKVFVHSMTLLDVCNALGTVAAHAVRCWRTTGGVVSTTVTPVAYPDHRYLTGNSQPWSITRTSAGVDIRLAAARTSAMDVGFVATMWPSARPGSTPGSRPPAARRPVR
jgi:hypothetical protein